MELRNVVGNGMGGVEKKFPQQKGEESTRLIFWLHTVLSCCFEINGSSITGHMTTIKFLRCPKCSQKLSPSLTSCLPSIAENE